MYSKRKLNLLIICLIYILVAHGACRSAQDLDDNKRQGNTPHNMRALLSVSVSGEGGDLRLEDSTQEEYVYAGRSTPKTLKIRRRSKSTDSTTPRFSTISPNSQNKTERENADQKKENTGLLLKKKPSVKDLAKKVIDPLKSRAKPQKQEENASETQNLPPVIPSILLEQQNAGEEKKASFSPYTQIIVDDSLVPNRPDIPKPIQRTRSWGKNTVLAVKLLKNEEQEELPQKNPFNREHQESSSLSGSSIGSNKTRTLPLRKEGSRKDVYVSIEPEDHDLVTGKNQGSQKRFSQKKNHLQQKGLSRKNLNSEGQYQGLSPRKGDVSPRGKDLNIKKINSEQAQEFPRNSSRIRSNSQGVKNQYHRSLNMGEEQGLPRHRERSNTEPGDIDALPTHLQNQKEPSQPNRVSQKRSINNPLQRGLSSKTLPLVLADTEASNVSVFSNQIEENTQTSGYQKGKRQLNSPKIAVEQEKPKTLLQSSNSITVSLEPSEESSNSEGESGYLLLGQEQVKSALTTFKKNRGPSQLMEALDEGFFNPPSSWKMVCAEGLGALSGLVPSSAATGMLMYLTADFLGIPRGSWSVVFPVIFMSTLTPVYFMQFQERAQIIGTYLFGEERFAEKLSTPLPSYYPYSWKVGYKRPLSQHFMNGFAFLAGGFRALCYTGILVLAEKDFPVFTGITGPFFFLSFLEQYYAMGVRNVQSIFEDKLNKEPEGEFLYTGQKHKITEIEDWFYASTPQNHEQARKYRAALLLRIQQFQIAMEQRDKFAQDIYETIKNEYDILKGLSVGEKGYFALSALLLKPVAYEEEDSMENASNTPTENSCRSQLENTLSYLNILCKGAAMLVRPVVMEYMIERFWVDFIKLPSEIAIPLALTGAGLELLFKVMTEYKEITDYNAHKLSFTNLPNLSLTSVAALTPATFYTLAGVFLGWQNLDRWGTPMVMKVGMMVPYVIEDFPPHYQFLHGKLESFTTASLTTVPEFVKKNSPECLKKPTSSCFSCFSKCIPGSMSKWFSLYKARTWLRKWSGDFYGCVENTFDAITLQSLYFTTQQPEDFGSDYEENVMYHEHDANESFSQEDYSSDDDI